jgi:hypothetical protein
LRISLLNFGPGAWSDLLALIRLKLLSVLDLKVENIFRTNDRIGVDLSKIDKLIEELSLSIPSASFYL